MAKDAIQKFKYSIHLALPSVLHFKDFLTESAQASVAEIPLREKLPFACALFVKPLKPVVPEWARTLDEHFEVDRKILSSPSAAVLMFQCEQRIFACAYGHGHTLLDDERRENDFGLLVAANSLSDENVRLVEKANLGSVIRDATQAAGITKLEEFNVDRALSLVRKLSGSSKDTKSSLSGASSITLTSERSVSEIKDLGDSLIQLFNSEQYKKTAFAIIDKIKPITNITKVSELDQFLLDDILSDAPSFELGIPELDNEPVGYITITGTGHRKRYADVSLELFLSEVEPLKGISDLHRNKISTWSIDGAHKIKEWTFYRGLVGSLSMGKQRFAINEGKWYQIEDALRDSANKAFAEASTGLDKVFTSWPIKGVGMGSKTKVYIAEKDYNIRVKKNDAGSFCLFDTNLFKVPNVPGNGIEICDLFDIKNKKLIHVKKSGRRSSVISHFLAQGMNSAKVLRTYPAVKEKFISAIRAEMGNEIADELEKSFPGGWTVEYKFGDIPNSKGDYTIPFFSRVMLDETKREIEAWGYKRVEVSFIRLSNAADPPIGS